MTVFQKKILKSVGASLPLIGLALWAKAYFLVPLIVVFSSLFFLLRKKEPVQLFLNKWPLRLKRAFLIGEAVLIGAGIGAYVMNFMVDVDAISSPNNSYISFCIINKMKYGAVIDKNHRTFALNHIRRGNKVMVSIGDSIKSSLRVAAVPNDTIAIVNGCAIVNGSSMYESNNAVAQFCVSHTTPLNIVHQLQHYTNELVDSAFRTTSKIDPICTLPVKEVYDKWSNYTYSVLRSNSKDSRVFPQSLVNNNGLQIHPIYLPRQGECVSFTSENRDCLTRLIESYEDKSVSVHQGIVYIDNVPAKEYTFLYNYYFVLNDNRSILADSRLWGPIPEYEIIGSALTISIQHR